MVDIISEIGHKIISNSLGVVYYTFYLWKQCIFLNRCI